MFVRASAERDVAAAVQARSGRTIEECEADAVAGKFPAPRPFARSRAPERNPEIRPLDLAKRPRRNRRSPALREAFQETRITPANLVLPLFIQEKDTPIGAMPGCFRLGWRHGLLDEVYKSRDVGVNSFVLFPKVPDAFKSQTGDEAYNDNGLVPRTIRLLKDKYLNIVIYTDVALDPYSSDGHDGIVREDGSSCADVVSPSDMMDGRVGAIRAALDAEGFYDVSIMSYTAKYTIFVNQTFLIFFQLILNVIMLIGTAYIRHASSFYGPFREALDSNPRFGDKKTYESQNLALRLMNPANYREALIETAADEVEGADILLVKPGLPYLDVIRLLRENSALPIAAYQVGFTRHFQVGPRACSRRYVGLASWAALYCVLSSDYLSQFPNDSA
uniref:Delta-aminolevulinic acid dehydratase n=1 Tax=Oryza punctata TaxID=4537 RepID=A0A0E0JVB7_ORYPU